MTDGAAPPPGGPTPPAPPAPPPGAGGSASRAANPTEVTLSGSLIAGAFGLIGIAAVTAPQYIDKVEPGPLRIGSLFGILAVALFVVSIIIGGRGQGRVTPGSNNAFHWQALTGLLGIVSLCIAAAIFTAFPKMPDADLARRLAAVEGQLAGLNARLAAVETRSRLEACAAVPSCTPCRPPEKTRRATAKPAPREAVCPPAGHPKT